MVMKGTSNLRTRLNQQLNEISLWQTRGLHLTKDHRHQG